MAATSIGTKIMLVIYGVLIGLGASFELAVSQPHVFAYHGKEVSQTLYYAHFVPLMIDKNHQVKVVVSYSVEDRSIIDQYINAVMKVYSRKDGTLLKTSSFPTGLTLNQTGKAQFATTIADNTINYVTAVVTFINATNNLPLSNPLTVKLNLGKIIQP
jgi:hypothetical protein